MTMLLHPFFPHGGKTFNLANKFRITGTWESDQVVNITEPAKSLPQDMRDQANALFKRFSAGRKEAYDGRLGGLRRLEISGNQLILTAVAVRFSEYLATRDPAHTASWPRANPAGTTSILFTQDNHIVVSVRSLKAEQNP